MLMSATRGRRAGAAHDVAVFQRPDGANDAPAPQAAASAQRPVRCVAGARFNGACHCVLFGGESILASFQEVGWLSRRDALGHLRGG